MIDKHGKHTYAQLLAGATQLASSVGSLSRVNDRPPTVASICTRDASYVHAQWATWMLGGIAVPLADSYPPSELEYFLRDSGARTAFLHSGVASTFSPLLQAMKVPAVVADAPPARGMSGAALPSEAARGDLSHVPAGSGAMLIYTSGTTSKPKGVLTTHENLKAQITALTTAWEWAPSDRILHVLPLHHVHGIMAVMLCAFWSGAACEMLPKFDAAATWAALVRPKGDPDALTVFMAVPTVYAKLIEHYTAQPEATQRRWSSILKTESAIRLMVSGSAALPEPILRKWLDISGHFLLERFGMSEFGMAISNSYRGTRVANSVGLPLPGYDIRIVEEVEGAADSFNKVARGQAGELHVRGPGVFSEYWGKPAATAETFTRDGWFRTGDSVLQDPAGNVCIQGRMSADIIKSGGYKISALEIERVLLDAPEVAEIVVLGAPDETYGERVAAVVTLKPDAAAATSAMTDKERNAHVLTRLRAWAKERLAHYKQPTVALVMTSIPRNAMGKVNKKALKVELFGGKK